MTINEKELKYSWDYEDVRQTDDIIGELGYRCSRCYGRDYLGITPEGEVICEFCRPTEKPYIVLRHPKRFHKAINENQFELNETFHCRISHGAIHMHLTPTKVTRELLRCFEKDLVDALLKLELVLERNGEATCIYAASPLIRVKRVQGIFKEYGYSIQEITNKEILAKFDKYALEAIKYRKG